MATVATRMSWVLGLASISLVATSCSTALQGPTPCEGMTCGTGQLCIAGKNLPDDGGIAARCVDVPISCPLYDCGLNGEAACPSCIDALCMEGSQTLANVVGRTMHCY